MGQRITLNTFRRLDRAEETVARAMMPRTSAADPAPVPVRGWARTTVRTARTLPLRPLTFTLGEVARG